MSLEKERSLQGTLVAIDAQCNLLLDHVYERTIIPTTTGNKKNDRSLGLVSVPKSSIKSIELKKARLNELTRLKQELLNDIV